jgi:hypothetical protein
MSSRVLAGLLAAGCVTAAAGGAFIAVRQNAATAVPVAASQAPAANRAAAPVAETEAVVGTPAPSEPAAAATEPATASKPGQAEAEVQDVARPGASVGRREPARPVPSPVRPREQTRTPAATKSAAPRPAAPPPVAAPPTPQPGPSVPLQNARVEPSQEPARLPDPPAPPVPEFEEVVLPSSSVIGLEVDTALSSERARVEDRVDARVTRDVMADGRIAIPAGSRVLGAVTLVERGGKVKESARLGVRFHTLVLSNGREVPLNTEPLYRDGESPAADSARKIGGAAVGGAILGAIIGGGKGAMIGGATGAAGGSAVVMTGDRRAATLASGSVVTVRLSAPATIEVEKRTQR